ncbi:RING finger domain protein [Apiospora arundinis]
MVTSTVTSVAKMAYTLLVIACLAFAVAADTPTIRNITVVPDYYTKPGMTCAITPSDTGPLADRVPISPLTRQAGLNGTIVQSKHGRDELLPGGEPAYTSIWTMVSNDEANRAKTMVMNSGGTVRAAITGNDAQGDSPPNPQGGGNNSAVAMSILYSITGLITLLFLIIIGTGAVRAHRHPERYGPRPMQSRARGLARAVLETLPIVKFGDPAAPAKGDLEQELESVSGDHRPSSAKVTHTVQSRETVDTPNVPAEATTKGKSGPEANPAVASTPAARPDSHVNDENLGCSICTDDFTVGEDVRVLPCDHRFHPGCVDPWLVNVSGTCPLCRLDLRPQSTQDGDNGEGEQADLAAQRSHGEVESNDGDAGHRRRRSRLLDWNMLRHASVDERIRALRQFREQHGASDNAASEERAGHNLADRLRDKFHIRTRTQPPRDAE